MRTSFFFPRSLLAAAAACALAFGCAPRRIPGTEIDDTQDTRAILALIEEYRAAVEARSADRVLALVAESFEDDAGTPNPQDDLNYAQLRERLPTNLSKVEDVHLDMNVKRVDVEQDQARATYTYSASFRMPHLSTKPQQESEIKQMVLKRVGGQWKIVSGL